MRAGAQIILETDDDNYPQTGFFDPRSRIMSAARVTQQGWVNVYRYFSDAVIRPRGLPLDSIHTPLDPYQALAISELDCPIQQGRVTTALTFPRFRSVQPMR
jgi:hypothetical protein